MLVPVNRALLRRQLFISRGFEMLQLVFGCRTTSLTLVDIRELIQSLPRVQKSETRYRVPFAIEGLSPGLL